MTRKERIYLYGLAAMMSLNLVGCSIKKNETKALPTLNEIELPLYNIYEEHYNVYVNKFVEDNEVKKKYWTSNIVIGINKETNEISRYIYYYGDAKYYLYENIINPKTLNGEIMELFNLDTGELLYFNNFEDSSLMIGEDNLNKMIEENDFYFLNSYYEDIDFEYKAWYSVEEINDIAKKFIEKKDKIKKLELRN